MHFYTVVMHRHTTTRIEYVLVANSEDEAADIAAEMVDHPVEPSSSEVISDDVETLDVIRNHLTLDQLENM